MSSIQSSTLRTLALLGAAITCMAGLIIWTTIQMNQAEKVSYEGRAITRAAAGLTLLAAESRPSALTDAQWLASSQSIRASAARIIALPQDAEFEVAAIIQELDALDDIYALARHADTTERQANILLETLAGKVQSLQGSALALLEWSFSERTRLTTQTRHALLAILLMVALAAAAAALFLYRRVVGPVGRIQHAISGYVLGQPIPDVGPVQVTELANIVDAVQAMTKSLEQSVVSRQTLEAEIVERRRAELSVREAYDRLRESQERMVQMEKLSALGTLVGGVAHEINNPLMGLGSYVKYAHTHSTDPQVLKYLERAGEEVDRIGRLVRNMLVFARVRSPEANDQCALAPVIQRTLELTAADLRRADCTVQVEVPEGLRVRCHEDALQQILLNLLLNARDALLDSSQPSREITLRAERQASHVRLQVCDNGPGIPPKIAHRIFDPFFTTKPPGKGTGLGLAVARQMAEAAKGELSLVNGAQGGTCFELTLLASGGEENMKGEDKHAA